MKIWCVDCYNFSNICNSRLFFSKMEAQNYFDSLCKNNYRKMYQVEDIWHWCAGHFNQVIFEVLASRDNGDNFTYIYGLVEELKEAAAHCGLKQFNIDGFWTKDSSFVLSVAWVNNGNLFHYTWEFDALDDKYDYPTITKRRSKWDRKEDR